MKLTKIAIVPLALALTACGAEHPNGATLAQEKGCVSCHGMDGNGIADSYPNLNGHWERYLRLQLIAYRDGKRKNGIMNGMTAGLTKAEINALAEFYGS